MSPRNAISSITTEKLAWKTIGFGQSRSGSKYSTSAGCCTRRRPQNANATDLETKTSSRDFGAIRRYARESADRLVPCITFSWTRKMAQRRRPWKRPNRALSAITLASMLPKLPFSHRLHGDAEGTAFGSLKSKQVVATIAYGIRGLRRGETTWGWPDFDADPEQENLAQLSRWSLNSAPAWEFPPLQSPINTKISKRTK